MFVLGIDPGLTRCGYGAVIREAGELTAVAAGVLRTPADADVPDRLAELQAGIRALLAELRPDVVAVERLFFQSNVRTAMAVGQASGVVLAEAAGGGRTVVMYTPNEVKSAVTGSGAAGKEQVQRMVQAILKLATTPKPPDAADALALALCHHARATARSSDRAERTMIGALRGTIVERSTVGEVLIDVQGVCYRVNVTPATLATLAEANATVLLHTHLHVRETELTLFGFASRDERACFEALLGAHGVGPAMAMSILAVHQPEALREIVASDDTDALCLVSGIGKKTAVRLMLELTSRLDLPFIDSVPTIADTPRAEVRDALAALGYGPEEIREATRELPTDGDVQLLLKHALGRMAAV